jgi:hypothetical protein
MVDFGRFSRSRVILVMSKAQCCLRRRSVQPFSMPVAEELAMRLGAGSVRQVSAIRPSRPCRSRRVIIGAVLRQSGRVSLGSTAMGTTDHRKCAEECVAMARLADAESDKALWLTLAQSWVRLAEHVARAESRATALETSEEIVA